MTVSESPSSGYLSSLSAHPPSRWLFPSLDPVPPRNSTPKTSAPLPILKFQAESLFDFQLLPHPAKYFILIFTILGCYCLYMSFSLRAGTYYLFLYLYFLARYLRYIKYPKMFVIQSQLPLLLPGEIENSLNLLYSSTT